MSEDPKLCALPGCSATIEQPEEGGPARLYCTAAHRAAARKLRHTSKSGTAATSPAVADTTPPQVAAAAMATTEPSSPRPEIPDAGSPSVEPAVDERPSVAPVPVVRPATDGRRAPLRPSERRAAAVVRRRRAVASLAAVSLVAGGGNYFLNSSSSPVAPVSPAAQRPTAPKPPPEADQWAARAEVALASISKQLDSVAQAEASWVQLPEHRRSTKPPAVSAMLERKALLEQQRVMLQSQLATLRSLPKMSGDLRAAQGELDAIERALRTAPPATTSTDQNDAVQRLAAQREMRLQQRDNSVAELENLQNSVQKMLAQPLPDTSDDTAPVIEQVLALVHHQPSPSRPRADTAKQPPLALLRRDGSQGRERQDASRTAPPDPSHPLAAARQGGERGSGSRDQRDDVRRDGGEVRDVHQPADLILAAATGTGSEHHSAPAHEERRVADQIEHVGGRTGHSDGSADDTAASRSRHSENADNERAGNRQRPMSKSQRTKAKEAKEAEEAKEARKKDAAKSHGAEDTESRDKGKGKGKGKAPQSDHDAEDKDKDKDKPGSGSDADADSGAGAKDDGKGKGGKSDNKDKGGKSKDQADRKDGDKDGSDAEVDPPNNGKGKGGKSDDTDQAGAKNKDKPAGDADLDLKPKPKPRTGTGPQGNTAPKTDPKTEAKAKAKADADVESKDQQAASA